MKVGSFVGGGSRGKISLEHQIPSLLVEVRTECGRKAV